MITKNRLAHIDAQEQHVNRKINTARFLAVTTYLASALGLFVAVCLILQGSITLIEAFT